MACSLALLLASILYLVVVAAVAVAAGASDSTLGLPADRLTRGETVPLRWSGVAEHHYPLSMQARFFNQTSGGIFSVRTTIATGLRGTEFEWENIPAPLDFIPSARYELILVPQGLDEPRVAYEGLFRIVEAGDTGSGAGNGGDASSGDNSSGSGTSEDKNSGASDKSVAIGAGVGLGLGLPVAIAIAWWFRRQTKNKGIQLSGFEKRF